MCCKKHTSFLLQSLFSALAAVWSVNSHGSMTHYHSCQSLLLLNLNHLFQMHSLYLWLNHIIFCLMFSKSSLTHSTNTVIIFECICIFDTSIKQWLISPLWEVPVAFSHICPFTVYARAWCSAFMHPAGLSKFFKYTSTSLFTGSTFSWKFNIFHEYLVQHSLKLGGTNCHFKWVPGTAPY